MHFPEHEKRKEVVRLDGAVMQYVVAYSPGEHGWVHHYVKPFEVVGGKLKAVTEYGRVEVSG